jgi:hypothetical protein
MWTGLFLADFFTKHLVTLSAIELTKMTEIVNISELRLYSFLDSLAAEPTLCT